MTLSIMNIYSYFLENFVLQSGDKLFNHNMVQRLKFLRKAQWWDQSQIKKFKNLQFQKLIKIAFDEIPFYRELITSIGVNSLDFPNDLKIEYLPLVTKKMLRDAGFSKTVRNTGLKTYKASTSGSTGENFTIIEDNPTAGFYRASFMLSLEWAGYKIGQSHLQTGMTLERSVDRKIKDYVLRCHYMSAYDLSDDHLDYMLSIIQKKNIKHVWGYPGSIFYLAKRANLRGLHYPLTSVVTWGDVLYSSYRDLIENTFGTKVIDTYGCAEGIQIASQCGFGSHYHVHEFDTIVELVDDNGNPVDKGETGNVVLTRLYPGPMPLIRYVVGDKATWSENDACECGRKLQLLERIDGRSADEIITPSGNRLILHFFTGILEFFPEIESFQVVQEEKTSITLNLVPRAGYVINEGKIITSLHEKGADLKIIINIVESIPLEKTGKRKFILSKMKSQN